MKKTISIVVPFYNEEEVIDLFTSRLFSVCCKINQYLFEFIFVDDGSMDRTKKYLDRLNNHRPVKIISLKENVGQQKAIMAGLKKATGMATIVLDADLQDPPEYIPELIRRWESGADAVMCQRESRTDNLLKRFTAAIYYRMMQIIDSKLPLDCGDYYLIDRKILNKIIRIDHKSPYLRGLLPKTAKKTSFLPIKRMGRAAGKSSYSFPKVLWLAFSGIRFLGYKNEE